MLDQAQGNSPDIVIMDGSQASSFLRDTLTTGGTAILRGETADDPGLGFAHSVASGLSMCPRRLESRYLYDRQGSAIFDRITEQPEYYLTRTEAKPRLGRRRRGRMQHGRLAGDARLGR